MDIKDRGGPVAVPFASSMSVIKRCSVCSVPVDRPCSGPLDLGIIGPSTPSSIPYLSRCAGRPHTLQLRPFAYHLPPAPVGIRPRVISGTVDVLFAVYIVDPSCP